MEKIKGEAVMINRKKSALAPATQVVVGRQRTQAHRSMSALPHADAIDIREGREALGGANRHLEIEERVLSATIFVNISASWLPTLNSCTKRIQQT
jgi:hypothetical protein